jgi:hypothetical protein
MERLGLREVRQEEFPVRHWERGAVERVTLSVPGDPPAPLSACALGGSVGTPAGGLEAGVVRLLSLDEVAARAGEVRGRIVFFDRAMDPTHPVTFRAYGGAADQRVDGASAAAGAGAVGVLIRSLTLRHDDVPHTGILNYTGAAPQIPAAALGIESADRLTEALAAHPDLRVSLELSAEELPPVTAVNTLGQVTGAERPGEVVVLGCHLDAWDKGCGAHDDGAGCAQVVEAIRLLRGLGLPMTRTVRAVLYMDEETGGFGGRAYAAHPAREEERHVYAIESDRGGFVPVGFTVDAADAAVAAIQARLMPLLKPLGLYFVEKGGGGADIGPLRDQGCICIGLVPDSQRYFDVHHSDNDVPDAVNPRELELGAVAMAVAAYVLANE